MEKLLILGAGQYAMVVREIAQSLNCYDRIDFLDDKSPLALGKLEEVARFFPEYRHAIVAMRNPQIRGSWTEQLQKTGFTVPTLSHPRAYVSVSAVLAVGTVVEPMAVVQTGARIGTGSLLCAGSVVNHNACVGDFCQIDCNAVVPANSQVAAGTKVPCGSVYAAQV